MVGLYNRYSGIIIILSVLLPIIISVIHYLIIGVKGARLNGSANVIKRFSGTERIFHFIRMLSFIIVAATGIYFVFHDGNRSTGMTHSINGIVFLIISICTLFIWFKPGLFKAYDRLWLRHLGGYLSKKSIPLPAGKFNAGQKIFFWFTILFSLILAITGEHLMEGAIAQNQVNGFILAVHGITAALAVISVIGHIYLSLWANKGTWRVLTSGKVSGEWAQCHHPDWEINHPTEH